MRRSDRSRRSLGDPSPANIIIDGDDRLWLVDLPARVVVRPAQWDLALLAYRLARQLKWQRSGLPGDPASYGAVADAVLLGYASRVSGVVDSEPGARLFYAFFALEVLRGFRGRWLRGESRHQKWVLAPASLSMLLQSARRLVTTRDLRLRPRPGKGA